VFCLVVSWFSAVPPPQVFIEPVAVSGAHLGSARSVDVECKHCTGKFVSIRFDNRAQNLQLLLPVTLEINRSKLEEAASLTIDIAALCAVACACCWLLAAVDVAVQRLAMYPSAA
jgi:hypothetical protein